MTEGILEHDDDGLPVLRSTRRLDHPVERMWRAVTSPDELAAWFLAPLDLTRAGHRLEAMEELGEVLRCEPPRFVEWMWGAETLSFQLAPDGEGTLLTVRHAFARGDHAADYASGWHVHVDRLLAHLDGQVVPEAEPARPVALNDDYADRFGLDPEVGRRVIAEHYGTTG